MINIDKIRLLDNEDLIDLYAAIVRIDHYDPFVTPQFAKDLHDAGITQYDIKEEILSRM